MELAIYFENGHVAYFMDVKNFKETENGIEFEYFGVASQRHRHAVFGTYAGYSITTD